MAESNLQCVLQKFQMFCYNPEDSEPIKKNKKVFLTFLII